MKRSLVPAVAAGLLALSGSWLPVRPQDDVATLRQELDATRLALADVTDELAEVRATLEETVEYLGAQARAADQMAASLAASEAAGFTAGINFESREILLAGWREQLAAMQSDVPGAGARADAEPTGAR